MASSTLSLDSLSSPSPSPSPPPQHNRQVKPASTTAIPTSTPTTASTSHKYKSSYRSLDEDSELSELTEAEDDQDASIPTDKRTISDSTKPGGSSSVTVTANAVLTAKPTSSSSSSMKKPTSNAGSSSKESEEQGMTSSSSKAGGGRRGGHQRSASSRRGGGGRRQKRSSIVPAPMWGWADPKPAVAAPAEEEEEEMPSQPKIMEEEEEEEEAEEEEEEEGDEFEEGSAGAEEEEEEEDRARSANYYQRNPYGQRVANNANNTKTRGNGKRGGRRQTASSSRKHDEDAVGGDNDPPKTWTRSKPPSLSTPGIRKARQRNDDDDDDDQGHDIEDSTVPTETNGADKGDSASGGSTYPSPNVTRKKTHARRKPGRSAASVSDSEQIPASSNTRKKKVNGSSSKPPRSSNTHPSSSAARNNDVESESEAHANDDPPSSDDEKTDSEGDPTPKKTVSNPTQSSPTKTLAKPLSSSNAAKPNSKVSSSVPHNAAALALSALAAAADAVDPTDPGHKAVASINAAAASASIMAGSTSLVEPVSKSDSQADDAGNGVSSGAADNTPSPSRSPSPGAASDDESEQSADEPVKTARGRGRRGKPAGRANRGRGRGAGSSRAGGRKGPPPALRIDTSVEDSSKAVAVGDDDAMDVDEQDETSAHPDTAVNDRDSDDGHNNEPDEPEPEEEEEEDSGDERSAQGANDHEEEQAEEGQVDGDDEAQEREREAEDNEQAVDNDAEREPDHDAEDRDHENEVDHDEEAANDADMDADDHESDLQPAHRAEALDVLANIELKFALLRERVYVEKMEELGWEERLVKEGAHPEMIHLQKELSKRKDKRLELASRKRSYEVAHATKRRKRDEEAIWSWWKFTTEELQTEMIAETSRKRRKIERERRALERPQPVRRIPAPIPPMIPPTPSIRKILKSYPFGSRKHNKSELVNIYPQLSNNFPRHYIYPEITTLSASEISNDLDYLLANRRQPYDAYPPLQMPQSYSQQGLQRTGGPSLGRGSMGLGLSNGQTPVPQPGMMGPPGPMQPGMPYDQYGDVQMSSQPTYGPGGPPPGRIRENAHPPPPPGPGGPPPPRENPYPTFPSNSGNRSHQHSQGSSMPAPGGSSHGFPPGHDYPGDHDPNAVGPGVSSSGGGHQLHPHHPYFSQGSMMGPGAYPAPSQMGLSSNPPHPGSGMKNAYNRRSMSPPPPHMQSNGGSGQGSKHWSGPGMGGYPPVNGKGVEWDPRIPHDEAERERERAMRERDREFRKREEREKERDVTDRERGLRYRDREYEERERREMQPSSSQHGGPPPGSHSHPPGPRDAPPLQGGSNAPYHSGSHHHHRPAHHHHVVHRHHTQGGPQHSHNSPIPGAAVAHSPRGGREYDRPPSSMHSGPPGEPSNPPGGKGIPPRERDPSWQGKGSDEPSHPMMNDYDRDREPRKPHSRRPSPGPPMVPLDRDRPLATPFVMASTQTMQQLNGASSSPRNGPSWNGPGSSSDDAYRGHAPSSGPSQPYGASPHDAHMRSPAQRYAPANRAPSSGSSQAPFHRMGSPPPPVSRARPPPSPSYPNHTARSPLTSPKMRPMSPPPSNPKSQLSTTGPPAYSSPHLAGPGRITPTGHPSMSGSGGSGPGQTEPMAKNGIGGPTYGSRTASPLMSSLHPPILGRPSLNGGGNGTSASDRDRLERADRERHMTMPSPRLGAPSSVTLPPTSKLSATPLVDGH
ncbi:hypothetical protein CVT24_012498 [Panaeolus cyanescens]|uniref:Uncharacterized protein n=1 Tax=Panaeolus cyanescens TaxID=181874 RepID=A0A409YJY1_9AGAR|nr:hypothetical protein CVT24_012498 [Panaeolus cyanescens]